MRSTKKKCRSGAGEEPPLKRRIKCRRFSSPLSSDEETETGDESDFSSYAPTPPPDLLGRPILSGGLGGDTSDNRGMEIGVQLKSPQVSPMAVNYEQQGWAGEIVDEKEVKQGHGRPRKQYFVRWEPSWVDGGRLIAPGLVDSWKEKTTRSKRRR